MKKLIVGLGNPGPQYNETRHNLGFMVADKLTELPQDYEILKPQKFMNLSGHEVAQRAKYLNVEPGNIWIIHDELDLPFGTIRICKGGSSAGHNGIQSVIDEIKSPEFWRIRVGINRPEDLPSDKYVLQKFSESEEVKLPEIIDLAAKTVLEFINQGKPEEKTIKI